MMDRNRRFEALAVCEGEALATLAEQALTAGAALTVLRPPMVGAVMMRARDPGQGGRFNLGEVVATEAEVELGGERGYALVMGVRPKEALAAAIVDAAAEALPDLGDTIEEALAGALRAHEARRVLRRRRVAGTRVEFDEIP